MHYVLLQLLLANLVAVLALPTCSTAAAINANADVKLNHTARRLRGT